MSKRIHLQPLTPDERTEIQRLAVSRKEPVWLVQRARIIAAMGDDVTLAAIEAGFRAGLHSTAIGPWS